MAKVNVPYNIDELLGKAKRNRIGLWRRWKPRLLKAALVAFPLIGEWLARHYWKVL